MCQRLSDVSRGFLGILFPLGQIRAGTQKDIIVNFEQQFSVINMYGCHGLFTMENVIIIALINCIRHCVRREFIQIKIKFIRIFSFLLIWDENLGSHTG